MEDLILKYLQNNLTDAEAAELSAWLEEDVEHRKVFENLVGEWHLSSSSIQSAKKRVLKRVYSTNLSRPAPRVGFRFRTYLARAAAVVLLVAGATFMVWTIGYRDHAPEIATQEVLLEKKASRGQKSTFQLPDGSIVTLNSGSTLRYPQVFATNSREVSLEGEGFFAVTHDEQRPFSVVAHGAKTTVLGTSFNVRAYPEDPFTQVAVKTGRVAVRGKENEGEVVLMPHEMTAYSSDNRLGKQAFTSEAALFGWTEQELIFQETQLKEVLQTIGRWYDVKFEVINGDLAYHQTFTAAYQNPTLPKVLESLSFVYEFNYTIHEDKKTVTIR